MKRIIVDSGVTVAYLDKRDAWNEWTMEAMKSLPLPFYTCETVISESCFLLKHVHNGEQAVLSLIEKGVFQIDFSLSNEISTVKKLMSKYDNVQMSLADACLVRMSELIDDSVVFTLDSDFHIYRKHGRKKIDLIIPS